MTEFYGRDHADGPRDAGFVYANEPLLECPMCGGDIDYGYTYGGADEERHVGACEGGHDIYVSWVPSDELHPHDAFGCRPVGHDDEEEKEAERVSKVFVDEQNGDRVVVTNVCDEDADEYVVTYDHEKNPVTVADFSGNEQYPDDDTVVEAEYQSDRQEYDDVKTYAFPISRLEDPAEYESNDGNNDEPDTPSGEPFTHEKLVEATSRDTATPIDEDELTKSEFFTRHYFESRAQPNVVPAVMRDFSVVSQSESRDDDLDLIYIEEDEEVAIRLSRDADEDYTTEVQTVEETVTRRFGASTDAVRFAASRMCELSGDVE